MIKLDILGDPTDAWSMIALAALQAALAESGENPFVIEWHPLRRFPKLDPAGAPRHDVLGEALGGREGVAQYDREVMEAATALGLEVNMDRVLHLPNALNALRLIHWAGQEGHQLDMVEALQTAYFRDGADIGDIDTLAAIAATLDMDGEAVKRLLSGPADAAELREREAHSRKMGVKAVPTFIVGSHHVLPGAQPPALWLSVIKDIIAETSAPPDGTVH
ncbi:DsbA family oxidoreductase [Ketogulonicigenium vulgare]|uniref:DSBA-like protein thioredoxin family protein n=1 Tax=Ketogulonicigenium vulgare (strain WSH-001) TaxID=759362 RepID=F9Y5I8_KETVW|nr:DsbA family oxidoreductase [Ketogulonicigenium vulgare]ADO42545.1 DSBA-like thioredoxin family protein [Ketogulonicigenium vulgare Y25]AEM40741.1 DSBA-like protein thioredoxin family protein [Ketogulonicigenium vulgare WSH-001]ALJ80910.1 disulfide bond formation protein DsbA [Ketogulonicigenium vulgare]ANW33681.1 disulfide bond formation protein DsbA [Ketogulonicigenium vulgare]AOZ54458.1 DSBA-like thioredoxin family protein [Ketogulonicigenium vulgare]